jgi:hypothetical protein
VLESAVLAVRAIIRGFVEREAVTESAHAESVMHANPTTPLLHQVDAPVTFD